MNNFKIIHIYYAIMWAISSLDKLDLTILEKNCGDEKIIAEKNLITINTLSMKKHFTQENLLHCW